MGSGNSGEEKYSLPGDKDKEGGDKAEESEDKIESTLPFIVGEGLPVVPSKLVAKI